VTISGATRTFALLGRPVGHSLSPRLHNAWLQALKVDARYLAIDVPPERGHLVPDALRTLGLAGVNLTVPLKQSVLPQLDALAPSAVQAGAANVIVREGDRLVGHNTDGSGLVAHLQLQGIDLSRPAVVLGAGGAGRSVAASLLQAGLPRVHLLNRTVERAEAVAAVLGPALHPGPLSGRGLQQALPGTGLVVQATAGGGRAAVAGLPLDHLPPKACWVDLNYWDAEPPHRAELHRRGIRFDDGWGMLVAQAAEAFTLFTGHPLPLQRALELAGPR